MMDYIREHYARICQVADDLVRMGGEQPSEGLKHYIKALKEKLNEAR
jgi:hypothetical protein